MHPFAWAGSPLYTLTHRHFHGAMLRYCTFALFAIPQLACDSKQAEPDAGRVPRLDAAVSADASIHMDAAPTDATPVDATPLDAAPLDAAADADPRSLEDLWSPDFGPVPEDMPEEIRWMHGRMWCPSERPPRVMADGSSECDHVSTPTDPALQPESFGCRAWPSRSTEVGYGWPGGIGSWISCNPDRTICCSGEDIAFPPPCDWDTWPWSVQGASGYVPTAEAEAWLAANNLLVVAPGPPGTEPGVEYIPLDVYEAFPAALNNCHPICKAPACGP